MSDFPETTQSNSDKEQVIPVDQFIDLGLERNEVMTNMIELHNNTAREVDVLIHIVNALSADTIQKTDVEKNNLKTYLSELFSLKDAIQKVEPIVKYFRKLIESDDESLVKIVNNKISVERKVAIDILNWVNIFEPTLEERETQIYKMEQMLVKS